MTPEQRALFRAGDDAIFATLVGEYSPRLLGAAINLTGDRAAAHELVHDAWIQAYRARATFRDDGSFLGWMLTIMRNSRRTNWRGDSRRMARDATYLRGVPDTTTPHDAVDAEDELRQRRAQMLDAVDALSERQRDVLVLRVFEEKSVAETAQELGVATGTVKATLSRAIASLREIIMENAR